MIMPRLKINVPEHFSFSTSIPIRITDLNYGNHVGNDTILSIIHEARMQYLKNNNYTEMNLEGVGMIMSDVCIEFKAEIFYGDIVCAFVTANEFTRYGFEIVYKLMNGSQDKIVALAKTGMIAYDYELKKVARLPEKVKEKLSG